MEARPSPKMKLMKTAMLGIDIIFINETILEKGRGDNSLCRKYRIVDLRREHGNKATMQFFNHIRFFPFLLGFAVGMFIVYILKPSAVVVVKYPNLENADHVVYRDRNGTCFKYDVKEVNCDAAEDRIKPYPLQ
jgi:hypothetical protein